MSEVLQALCDLFWAMVQWVIIVGLLAAILAVPFYWTGFVGWPLAGWSFLYAAGLYQIGRIANAKTSLL